jgi:hypothetical protein
MLQMHGAPVAKNGLAIGGALGVKLSGSLFLVDIGKHVL